jgi:hypothetical protein
MNWIKRLFSKNKTAKQCDIHVVSGALPMWTTIHIQPIDINNIEGSRVYWIKHPQVKWTVYDKDLVIAIKGFNELWGNDH